MTPQLHAETEKLRQSWMRHSPETLRDYLVASVEDPRINMQSILTRHFIIRAVFGERFEELMHEEYRFSAGVASLLRFIDTLHHPEEREIILYALERGSDNAEGLEIPGSLVQCYKALPRVACGVSIPNYVERLIQELEFIEGMARLRGSGLDTFATAWKAVLDPQKTGENHEAATLPVLEPACGSANDARFFPDYGVDTLVAYTGFDLCPANVDNARSLFPQGHLDVGNVFEIQATDHDFHLCFVHDLFEHLSIEGLQLAVREICRVTGDSICAHFFNLDEIPEHRVLPVDGYHWNTLSLRGVQELFGAEGFRGQAVHIGTFLQRSFESQPTHNPNAYTLFLKRAR